MSEYTLLIDLSRVGIARTALWAQRTGTVTGLSYTARTADEFESAILQFLKEHDSPFLSAAAISAPGWEHDGVQHMPNHGYSFKRERLKQVFNVRRLHIVNTSLARALAIPALSPEEVECISEGGDEPEQVKAVIGTGPGLGVALLVPDTSGGWTAFAGAGGHSDLATTTELEQSIVAQLTRRFGHVSRERVVSMSGLSEIWTALDEIQGKAPRERPGPVEISALADAAHPQALQVVELCLGWLAATASDVTLMMGARGGIYLTGELTELLSRHLDPRKFRERYADKGRLSNFIGNVPVFNVKAVECELIGLSTLFT